jgi:WD40 repeat protein
MHAERSVVQNIYKGKQEDFKRFDKTSKNNDDEEDFIEEENETMKNSKKEGDEEEEREGEENTNEDEEEAESPTERQASSESESSSGTMSTLWEFQCSQSDGQNVNCMAWNRENKDILAVGYGNIDFVGAKQGLILCWTLKNPTAPERSIKIDHAGVSSLDYSEQNPSLLAVGFNDGAVKIFDVRQVGNVPVLETNKSHTGMVWDLQWVDQGKDLGERLHSVGVDGRINSWSIKKGLECHEIMRLKRGGRGADSGGMCIDFDPSNSDKYLVGTEDGLICKCSCSYTENSQETYIGHTGPVYRVRWNPIDPNVFISCSADWTVRVWNQEKFSPTLTIESFATKKQMRSSSVTDVAWSRHDMSVFASVSVTGTVEVWDLSYSSLKARHFKTKAGRKLSTVLFAEDSPAVLVGDDKGSVEVIKCG